MTTVTPPPPPPPPQAPPAVLPTVTVLQPPEALLKAVLGARLEGQILAQDAKGNLQLQTALGKLSLETPLPLPKGAALQLVVQSLGPKVHLQILSINGKPPAAVLGHAVLQSAVQGEGKPAVPVQGVLTGQAAGGGVQVGGVRGPGGLPFVSLTIGNSVKAMLLQPAQGASPTGQSSGGGGVAAPGHASPKLPGGAQLTTDLLTNPGKLAAFAKTAVETARANLHEGLSRLGAAGRPSGPGNATPGSGSAATVTKGGGTPALPAQGTMTLPAGTRVEVRIVSLQAPGSPSQPAAAAASRPVPLVPGQMLTGTVSGTTSTGQPTVTTLSGTLALETRAPVPAGTQVTLEIRGTPVLPSLLGDSLALKAQEGMMNARDWPSLKEAVEVLSQSGHGAAQNLAAAMIPRPDAGLAAGILLFVAALRGGDIRGWLGEAPTRILENAGSGLLPRLREDFRQRAKLFEDRQGGDWRVAMVPIHNGQDIEQVRFMMQFPPEQEDQDEGDATRFIVDVDLSRMGRVQLDGSVRADQKRLDLVVRTGSALPGEVRDKIRSIFGEAAELTGIVGGVVFQAAPAGFVEIPSAVADVEGVIA